MRRMYSIIILFLLPLAGCNWCGRRGGQEKEQYLLSHYYELFDVIGEKGPESTNEFIELLKSESISDRRVAAYFLWKLGDVHCPGFVAALERGLGDQDHEVRATTLRAIGTHGISGLLPRVREITLSDTNGVIQSAASDCLAMIPSVESIPVINELLERDKSSVEFRKNNPNRKEDAYWWSAYDELTLKRIIEGIEKIGADKFLSQQKIDANDYVEVTLLLWAMAWTGNRDYLKHVWPILENAQKGKDSYLCAAECAAIYAARKLATYEEAKPFLEPLAKNRPYSLECVVALRYMKWKDETQR
jgi:hypothetical protein